MEKIKLDKEIKYKDSFNDQLSFLFYSILKNEDADPAIVKYMQNGIDYTLITVADGLGGSGAERVLITDSDLCKYKEEILRLDDGFISLNVSNCFKTEFDDVTSEKSYFDLLMSDIKPNESYTNALLASRIVIFRFINYMINNNVDLSNPDDKKNLIDFIKKAIVNIKERLNITKKIELFSILPTTLVSIRYNETENKIDVIWAGDSRAYILTKNGLFQLSEDNEDSTGKMTNNFSYERKDIILNVKTFNVSDFTDDNKFVLLCTSDGFFDVFGANDYLYDEYMLLHFINKNNNIVDAYKEMKQTFENKYLGDDITVAYNAFGFESYDELKSYFNHRYETINNLLQDFEKYGKYIKYINIDEASVKSYVERRLKDFKNKFITYISDNPYKFKDIFGINNILEDKNSPYIDKLLTDNKINDISCINNYLKDKKVLFNNQINGTYPDMYASIKELIEWYEGNLQTKGIISIIKDTINNLNKSINNFKNFFVDNKMGVELTKIMDKEKIDDPVDILMDDLLLNVREYKKKSFKYLPLLNTTKAPKRYKDNEKKLVDINCLFLKYIDELNNEKATIEAKPTTIKNDIKYYAELKSIFIKIVDVFILLKKMIIEFLEQDYNDQKIKLAFIEKEYIEVYKKLVNDNKNNLDSIFYLDKISGIITEKERILELLKSIDDKTFVDTLVNYIKENDGLDQLFSAEALDEFRSYYELGAKVSIKQIEVLINNLNSLEKNYSTYLK